MNLVGVIMLEGYVNYQMYYKCVFEKFKIIIYIFCVGIYKFVVEFYICDDMFFVVKESNQCWLDVYWE